MVDGTANEASNEVSVTILPETAQQHFRLFELPAELLTLLTSENPPILQLKSNHDNTGDSKDASLVLCTTDKTYNVRQVNSSNSVWITQPDRTATVDDQDNRCIGIEAIAKPDSTIELSPAKEQSAAPYIKAALPMLISTGNYSSQASISREDLFANIPLDQATCDAAFRDLACFEPTSPPGCFLPSVKVKARILESIVPAATAADVDITSTSFKQGRVPEFAVDVAEDWPSELVIAMILSVSTINGDGDILIDHAKFVRHVGLSALLARCDNAPTDTEVFLKAWRDAMPEKWRGDCELSNLKGLHTLQNGGNNIGYVDGSDPIYDAILTGLKSGTTSSSQGTKRKWHEKFRPVKK